MDVVAVGEARVITPVGHGIDFWFGNGPTVTADFLDERAQPLPQERRAL